MHKEVGHIFETILAGQFFLAHRLAHRVVPKPEEINVDVISVVALFAACQSRNRSHEGILFAS